MHIRVLKFCKKNHLEILVIDELIFENSELHFFEIPFHFHPDIKIQQTSETVFKIFREEDFSFDLEIDKNLRAKIIKGQKDPLLGWCSPYFYKKTPIHVLYSTIEKSESFTLLTKIKFEN